MNRRSENHVFKEMIENIEKCSTSLSVKYIVKRLESPKYQGHTDVNHNRITVKKLEAFLELLNKHRRLKIPRGDAGKAKFDIRLYPEFEKFTNEFRGKTGEGTQNSIRKNLAVDFSRYGFMRRVWEKDGEFNVFIEGQNKRVPIGVTLFYEITDLGKLFIASDKLAKEKMLKGAVEEFHGEKITFIYYVLKRLEKISFFEYLMFVNKPIKINLSDSLEETVELIESWRALDRGLREGIEKLINSCDMKMQSKINKKYKFDYANWRNDTTQLIDTFKKTFLFKISRKYDFNITVDNFGKKKRDKGIYIEYNQKHQIEKKLGFEYHHIIPLMKAENQEQLILIDNVDNLIYIDAGVHAVFTQTGNPFLILKNMNGEQVTLMNSLKNQDYKIESEQALYNSGNFENMKEHNLRILESLGYEI